ncbi:ead/Ea22-like family protein, partial [Enterobacter hormaechei]
MSNIDKRADSVSRIIDDLKLKHGSGDTYAPIMRWDELLALLDELEAAEKRIAELERNEIREEGNQFLVVRYPGKLPVVKHCAGELEGFLRQLLEHDPMATIDIVTHRYYGVGGQWVQDADEYLQMMAAAAGKG